MKKLTAITSLAALAVSSPLGAQEAEKPEMLSPGQIVEQAAPEEWQAIAASDLLVMKLTPGAAGKDRTVIIQLMPPPFSQGWVRNIRKLAQANWWDGTSINRVQDNYVVQWGDPAGDGENRKPLPDGLEVMTESDYILSFESIFDQIEYGDLEALTVSAMNDGGEKEFSESVKQAEEIWKQTVQNTQGKRTKFGLRERDSYAPWIEFARGWPLGVDEDDAWPIHCYGMVGVGRGLSPNTGSGADLYTVIGHAPRHLDRNIAVVGRIVEGMHHLSSLPRGFGPLGFYETPEERVPIKSIHLASELPKAEQPRFEFLYTEYPTFAKYADRRANREPPFFIKPAGGADICNIPVPVRRIKDE